MDIVTTSRLDNDVVRRVAALVPWMQQHAAQLDATSTFPTHEIAALHAAGVLDLPLPAAAGRLSTYPPDTLADRMAAVLMQVGRGSLAVGRIIEAHMNARHLIARYGVPEQKIAAARDARRGELFALWVTDPPPNGRATNGLRMAFTANGVRLTGRKMFCSAAGHATRAVVTATNRDGEPQMLVVPLQRDERVEHLPAPLQGMRATATGAVDFDGCLLPLGACLGDPGDYMREPDFSAGAWRTSAVTVGGLCSLLALALAQLEAAGRRENAHQLQRLGSAMIACETSHLWLRQAARMGEDHSASPDHVVAYVGLARIAIETACLDAMQAVQRSLGLSAFCLGNPVERICRDLGTYLRQPAPDEVLTEAAAYFGREPTAQWP
jgi:alkylation response protein AidB-like acyl-CoA dehydrogenase